MSRRRGLTLLETLVAIALVLAMLAALYGFLWNVLDARRRIVERVDRQRAATLLVDRLEADLLATLAGGGRLGPGLRGDATSLEVLTRAVPARLALRDGAEAALADLERSRYRFEPGRGIVLTREAPDARRAAIATAPLGASIHRVRFRYLVAGAWQDRHAASTLPAAIEVAIWFDPPPGEEPEEDRDVEDPEDSGARPEFAEPAFDDEALDEAPIDPRAEEPVSLPDRLRVIPIPDAEAPPEEASP